MYKGTLIDDLMRTVEDAEDSAPPPAPEEDAEPSRGAENLSDVNHYERSNSQPK